MSATSEGKLDREEGRPDVHDRHQYALRLVLRHGRVVRARLYPQTEWRCVLSCTHEDTEGRLEERQQKGGEVRRADAGFRIGTSITQAADVTMARMVESSNGSPTRTLLPWASPSCVVMSA